MSFNNFIPPFRANLGHPRRLLGSLRAGAFTARHNLRDSFPENKAVRIIGLVGAGALIASRGGGLF